MLHNVTLLRALGPAALAAAVALAPAGAAPAAPAPARAAAANPAAPGAAAAPGALPESYPWPQLAQKLMPAVVNVRTTMAASGPSDQPEEMLPEPFRRFLPPGPGEQGQRPPRPQRRGLGTGVIVSPNGFVVTNHHVVDGASTVAVTLTDGRKLAAKVVGSDPETDLALLKVDATDLPAARFGSSAALKVGEPVMAIGNPFGLDHTVTVGVVSGKSRVIGAGRYDDFLQTDAAINPGNSGGPLVNTRGEVVGIATAIASRSGGFQGIGFAIPSDLVRPILAQLETEGHVTRGWLGVTAQPLTEELAKSFRVTGRRGAVVSSVVDGSPAAKAGLRPGDVIVRYDGQAVESARELSTLVAKTRVGQGVGLEVVRDGRPVTLQVTIGNLGESPQGRQARATTEEPREAGRLGVAVAPVTRDLARRFGIEDGTGVVVTDVQPGSPADRAGISEGDVIREIDRKPVAGIDDVQKALSQPVRAGQVLLRIERRGDARYVVVALS